MEDEMGGTKMQNDMQDERVAFSSCVLRCRPCRTENQEKKPTALKPEEKNEPPRLQPSVPLPRTNKKEIVQKRIPPTARQPVPVCDFNPANTRDRHPLTRHAHPAHPLPSAG